MPDTIGPQSPDPIIAELMPILGHRLRDEEGDRSKPYRDNSKSIGFEGRPGKLTIGIGRNLDDVGLSADEIQYLFMNDIRGKVADLDQHLPFWRGLTIQRQSVLVDLAFNMGIGSIDPPRGLLSFQRMLSAIQSDNYVAASQELLESEYAKEVGQRAVDLAQILLRG